jgi:K+-transporting ATPase ATPase A chain
MIGNGWLQIAIFGAIVVAITKPFGFYMTRVFVGEWTPLSPLLRPVERLVYRCCGVEESEEQSWRLYAISMMFRYSYHSCAVDVKNCGDTSK